MLLVCMPARFGWRNEITENRHSEHNADCTNEQIFYPTVSLACVRSYTINYVHTHYFMTIVRKIFYCVTPANENKQNVFSTVDAVLISFSINTRHRYQLTSVYNLLAIL